MSGDRKMVLDLVSAMCGAGLPAKAVTEADAFSSPSCFSVSVSVSGLHKVEIGGSEVDVDVALCSGSGRTEDEAWTACLENFLSGRCLDVAYRACAELGLAASSREELGLRLSVRGGEDRP